MINQIKVENYKFIRSLFFWLAMIFMISVGIYNGFKWDISAHATEIMTPFNQALPDMSFVFLPSLFTAWFIGNSFSTRTIHHEITSGSSRFSVIASRSLPTVLSGILLHAAYIVTTVVVLGSRIGFDTFTLTSDHVLFIVTVLATSMSVSSSASSLHSPLLMFSGTSSGMQDGIRFPSSTSGKIAAETTSSSALL